MSQTVLAYISGGALDHHVDRLRQWSRGEPRFVDEVDGDSGTRPDDEPVRTIGLLLVVSGPGEHPPTLASELARLIDALGAFSKDEGVDFELHLDDTYAGEIREGVPDRLVLDGLVARWDP